ncbi:MAG: hypothetical protein ACK4TF_01890 [Thermodesulfovibrionales bacterium]
MEILLIIISLLAAIGLSLLLTFLIVRFTGIKEIPGLKEAKRVLKDLKACIEAEVLPLDIKNFTALEALPLNLKEIRESLKELNILFIIMKREILLMVSDINEVSEDTNEDYLSIEKLLERWSQGNLKEEEIIRLPLEENKFFVLRDKDLKRFCEQLMEKNSVLRFIEAKKELLGLIEKIESQIYG